MIQLNIYSLGNKLLFHMVMITISFIMNIIRKSLFIKHQIIISRFVVAMLYCILIDKTVLSEDVMLK